jgi:sterol 3beta-glucosyltransferase
MIAIGDTKHDWLFPKMSAVVQHAGASTTAAGLRAGVPTVGVPMIAASRVTTFGAGPTAVPYKSLTAHSLTTAISDAVSRDSYRSRAQEIAKQLATEDGTLPVIRALDRQTT